MADEEEDEMSQKTRDAYILDEEAAQKIINSKPIKVKETNIPNNINLRQSERTLRAKEILESKLWK